MCVSCHTCTHTYIHTYIHRVDATLQQMLLEVRRKDASFIVQHDNRTEMVKSACKRAAEELSGVVRLNEECVHVIALHELKVCMYVCEYVCMYACMYV